MSFLNVRFSQVKHRTEKSSIKMEAVDSKQDQKLIERDTCKSDLKTNESSS